MWGNGKMEGKKVKERRLERTEIVMKENGGMKGLDMVKGHLHL